MNKSASLSDVFLVEDCMTGFPESFELCKENSLHLCFGVKFLVCNDLSIDDKNNSLHKIIVFAKNDSGFRSLGRLYSHVFTKQDGTTDYKTLKSFWSENLLLAFPFYDSHIFNNLFFFKTCLPDVHLDSSIYKSALFFSESNGLPFDLLMNNYLLSQKIEPISVKSIFYRNRNDFLAYLTYRLICSRSGYKKPSLSAPNIDHLASAEFCFQSFLENLHGTKI